MYRIEGGLRKCFEGSTVKKAKTKNGGTVPSNNLDHTVYVIGGVDGQ